MHCSNGEDIVKGLSKMLALLQENSSSIRNHSHDQSDTHKMRRNFNREQLEKITKCVNDQISQIKVSNLTLWSPLWYMTPLKWSRLGKRITSSLISSGSGTEPYRVVNPKIWIFRFPPIKICNRRVSEEADRIRRRRRPTESCFSLLQFARRRGQTGQRRNDWRSNQRHQETDFYFQI